MADLQRDNLNQPPSTARAAFDAVWPLLAAIGVGLLFQLVLRPNLNPYTAILMLTIGVNIVLAVSLTMVNGFTGQFSMGHAGFLAVGGYASGIITYYGSQKLFGSGALRAGMLNGMPIDASGLPLLGGGEWLFVIALIIGGLVSAGLGYIVGLPSLRLKGDYLAIVTLGFGEIVRVLIQQSGPVIQSPEQVKDAPLWKLPTAVGGALGFGNIPQYSSLFWVYLVAVITILVAVRLKRSSYGRAFLSIREDEIAAEAMGVNTTKFKIRAFVLAAFFAGVAGGLYGHQLGVSLSPTDAGFQKSFDFIIMVVLGGMGSISGACLAAIVVTLLPEYLRGVAEYRMVIYALALILMMIFRPQGLLGVHELWDAAFWRRKKRGGAR
ncbi:MAG: branched-chain amino acid ABC transporter permease [Planctomycetota bacterium]|nr:branched-chain amino acid ABC transporter permease [Planctomycetota bacterium]